MERVAVLHVDSGVRATLRSAIEDHGLVAVAVDSLSTLEHESESAGIALVVVDAATLAAVGGEALEDAVIGDRPMARAPIVLLARRGDAVLATSAMDVVDEILFEPIDPRELGLRLDSGLARRRTTDVVAAASHELRSPVHALVAFLDLLDKSHLDPSQREMLAGARTASRHLVDLIDDLLEHARLGRSPIALDAAPFSLRAIVGEAVSIALDAARTTKTPIDIAVHVDENVPEVYRGDGPRVRQILINLLGNALGFASSEPVDLRVRRTADGVEIEVSDDGPGVPDEARALVFEPFRQAHPSASRRLGGVGLGLAIARTLARHMGGDIVLGAREGAGGAVFRVTLALDVLVEGRAEPPRAAQPGPRPRALLADADAMHRGLVVPLLDRLGFDVEVAPEGIAALLHAIEHRPALVVIDLDLPVLSGSDVAKRLRAADASMPILGFARNLPREASETALASGISAVLDKPIAPLLLQRALRQATARQARRAQSEAPRAVRSDESRERSGERARVEAAHQMRDAVRAMIDAVEHHGRALDAAVARSDLGVAAEVASALRGAVHALNARGLETVLRDLEQAARAGDREECRRAHEAWQMAARRLREDVARFLARMSATG
jgi:signal transduction histidine kinase/AmiR/NasT family two-component response regulator